MSGPTACPMLSRYTSCQLDQQIFTYNQHKTRGSGSKRDTRLCLHPAPTTSLCLMQLINQFLLLADKRLVPGRVGQGIFYGGWMTQKDISDHGGIDMRAYNAKRCSSSIPAQLLDFVNSSLRQTLLLDCCVFASYFVSRTSDCSHLSY